MMNSDGIRSPRAGLKPKGTDAHANILIYIDPSLPNLVFRFLSTFHLTLFSSVSNAAGGISQSEIRVISRIHDI